MPGNTTGAPPVGEEGAPSPYDGIVGVLRDSYAQAMGQQSWDAWVTEQNERQRRMQAAEQAAGATFRARLTPVQASTWVRDGNLRVRSDLGRWWRIRRAGVSGNVDLMDGPGQHPVAAYCAHPTRDPAGQFMTESMVYLSQLLVLTYDEARFTQVAILHHTYPPPGQVPAGPRLLLPRWTPGRYYFTVEGETRDVPDGEP